MGAGRDLGGRVPRCGEGGWRRRGDALRGLPDADLVNGYVWVFLCPGERGRRAGGGACQNGHERWPYFQQSADSDLALFGRDEVPRHLVVVARVEEPSPRPLVGNESERPPGWREARGC